MRSAVRTNTKGQVGRGPSSLVLSNPRGVEASECKSQEGRCLVFWLLSSPRHDASTQALSEYSLDEGIWMLSHRPGQCLLEMGCPLRFISAGGESWATLFLLGPRAVLVCVQTKKKICGCPSSWSFGFLECRSLNRGL